MKKAPEWKSPSANVLQLFISKQFVQYVTQQQNITSSFTSGLEVKLEYIKKPGP